MDDDHINNFVRHNVTEDVVSKPRKLRKRRKDKDREASASETLCCGCRDLVRSEDDGADGQGTTKPPERPKVRLKAIDKDDKLFHNCATIVENSYVCPFETSFSDYHCIYCREIFTDPKELRDHTMTHDPKKYKDLVIRNRKIPQIDVLRIDCRLCEEKIEDLDTFKKHIITVHQIYLFP
ncbi:hypothetical protein MSG28_014528 [Choristoneura fumiferana]|nr:hypothetical protein MSG28_014528 [Choristoneura fumiferana]